MWREANRQRSSHGKGQPSYEADEKLSHGRAPIPEDIGDDLVLGSKEAVRQSWRLLREALIEGKVQKIGAWLSVHTRAIEANVKAESMVREEQERQKILIPLAEAQAMATKVVGVIVSRLNALPQNLAARCSLTDPHITILEEECAAILKDAQRAL
jgi:hypothetical protein